MIISANSSQTGSIYRYMNTIYFVSLSVLHTGRFSSSSSASYLAKASLKLEHAKSCSRVYWSIMMKIRSNRERSEVAMPVFWLLSYRLFHFCVLQGFVAARIVALVLILQQIPALAIDIVYCSIASWTLPRSSGLINENSSIQHVPQSERTNAPASKIQSLPSLKADTVRPAEVVPMPVVWTERMDTFWAYCRSYDLPVPGSPIINMWIWPLIRGSSPHCFGTPPISERRRPIFSEYRS